MNDLHQQLTTLGFKELPEFDPDYFQHRNPVGFILLLNEKHNLSYHVWTVNARSCLTSARRVVEFGNADRGAVLLKALSESVLEDWVVYFRPHGLYPGLRDQVKHLTQDYHSLNVRTPRLDDTETMHVYRVMHPAFKRSILITHPKELTDEQIVAKFLNKWRTSMEHGINRGTMKLETYYKGLGEQAEALQQWIRSEVKNFAILDIPSLTGKKRGEIRSHVSFENRVFFNLYKDKLVA